MMLLENYAATVSETCLLRFEHLKSNISLKENVHPGFDLIFRTLDSVHAIWTPKQRGNMIHSWHSILCFNRTWLTTREGSQKYERVKISNCISLNAFELFQIF